MIKPKRLKPGDTVALVNLSSGLLGEEQYIHKLEIGWRRLVEEFGLNLKIMPYALKDIFFTYHHPELRAKDLMDAFADPSVSAIITSVGGDDTIRLLPYIDEKIIKNNPKIFTGFSDTTANHLMMYKAGLVSYYGPNFLCNFAEYGAMSDYTKQAVWDVFFSDSTGYQIKPSPYWSMDTVPWEEKNKYTQKEMLPEAKGYEVLQGKGVVKGHFLGGCLDGFLMYNGTKIWPSIDAWKGAILFIEVSNDVPSPQMVTYMLRNLAAQGILKVVAGMVVGKPYREIYYEEYKQCLYDVIVEEEKLSDLPIFYNLNFGHAEPIGIIPYGIQVQLDCNNARITLLESATAE